MQTFICTFYITRRDRPKQRFFSSAAWIYFAALSLCLSFESRPWWNGAPARFAPESRHYIPFSRRRKGCQFISTVSAALSKVSLAMFGGVVQLILRLTQAKNQQCKDPNTAKLGIFYRFCSLAMYTVCYELVCEQLFTSSSACSARPLWKNLLILGLSHHSFRFLFFKKEH